MKLSAAIILILTGLSLQAIEIKGVAGAIEAVGEEDNKITIKHEGIGKLSLEAGLLEVEVSAGDYAIAEVGRRIRGTLTSHDENYLLHTIWPANKTDERSMMLINRDLTRPRIGQVNKGRLSVGDDLPRFAMFNQKGELITPESWAEKLVVLNFIFTRSPVPSMSPATTKRMVELQKRLMEEGHGDSVRMLSISLDPEYDTPGVSYSYLEDMGANHDYFWLLSGSPKTLQYLIKKIGVVATPSEKTILNHSMVMLIADREGKIFYRRPGSRWDVDDVYDRLKVLLTSWK